MGLPCHLCGRPIDYSLPAGDPWSYELDELVPIARLPREQRRAAACDPANVAPAHRICNERKGSRMPGDKAARGLPVRRSGRWGQGGCPSPGPGRRPRA